MTEPKERPIRVQLSRKKGFKLVSPNGLPIVKVDRSTKWGNPFVLENKAQSVDAFRDWLECAETGEPCATGTVFGAIETWEGYPRGRKMLMELHELRGKNLACWCRTSDCCHADVLLELANRKDVTKMSDIILQPRKCPFCNSDPVHIWVDEIEEGTWHVMCNVCRAYGPVDAKRESAIAAWNLCMRDN